MKSVIVRLSDQLATALDDEATQNGLSVNKYIGQILELHSIHYDTKLVPRKGEKKPDDVKTIAPPAHEVVEVPKTRSDTVRTFFKG